MALTVEDGTVVPNADSYVTVAEYAAYAAARGWTIRDTTGEDEQDLRRAYDVLNRKFEFRGRPANEDVQTGEFPRYIFKDQFNYLTPPDEVPQRVKDAQIEIAYIIRGGIDPMAVVETSKTSEKIKVGPIETDVETIPTGPPRLTVVEGLLSRYMAASGNQMSLSRG